MGPSKRPGSINRTILNFKTTAISEGRRSMSDKLMSRRKFLVGAGTVVGVASVAGLGLANRPDAAAAAGTAVPWPYPTDSALQPDPETLARRAYEVYYSSGCAEATWWPIVEALAPANPTTWG